MKPLLSVLCAALAALALLSGCGGDAPQPKGPALPYTAAPPKPADPVVLLTTSKGDLKLQLFEDDAPVTVRNFIELVEKGFYTGLTFHRIAKNYRGIFAIQGGDPKGDGSGGPGYCIPDEIEKNPNELQPGALAMANRGSKDSGGSQFFIMTTDNKDAGLGATYTVFGAVIKGLDTVGSIAMSPTGEGKDRERPNEPVTILSARVLSKRDHPYALAEKEKLPEQAGVATANKAPRRISVPGGKLDAKTLKELQSGGPVEITGGSPAPPAKPAPAAPAPEEKK